MVKHRIVRAQPLPYSLDIETRNFLSTESRFEDEKHIKSFTSCERRRFKGTEIEPRSPGPLANTLLIRPIVGSIQGRVIPKTLKWYLIPTCLTLSNIRYVSRVKLSNTGKGVAPSRTPRCSSYWKESLLVALNYGRQLYYK